MQVQCPTDTIDRMWHVHCKNENSKKKKFIETNVSSAYNKVKGDFWEKNKIYI